MEKHNDEVGPHITVQLRNVMPPLEKCTNCCTLIHCPFCPPRIFKPTVLSRVRKHLEGHMKRAVQHRGLTIFKCNLDCKDNAHFHCPACQKLIDRRNRFLEHLVQCIGGEIEAEREEVKKEEEMVEQAPIANSDPFFIVNCPSSTVDKLNEESSPLPSEAHMYPHVTVQPRNVTPPLEKCGHCCTLVHCPFCSPWIFKPTVLSKVRKHLEGHKRRAVQYRGYTIFKCNLCCKGTAHFHCPTCQRLFDRRCRLLEHLVQCVGEEEELPVQAPTANYSACYEDHNYQDDPENPTDWISDVLSNLDATEDTDPHLPLSPLHLFIPPLRLMSACLWQVALERNVDKYDKLVEFVSLVTDIVPDLLSYKQRTQLILGLRARVIVEFLTKMDSVDCDAVQQHLSIFQKDCSKEEEQDQEVKISKSAFVKQIQTLLRDKYERDKFVKEMFPELYGARFDTVLQILVWEFFYRLEEFIPVPSFSKVSSFIELSSFDSRFEQFFCDQDDLRTILHHQKKRRKLPKSEFSFMSDTILSTLASKQMSADSEVPVQGVKSGESGASSDEETDDSSVDHEASDSQWRDRGLSLLTNSPCSERGKAAGDDDNTGNLVHQTTSSSQTVVSNTQVILMEQNSDISEVNSAGVQKSGSKGGSKPNRASRLKNIQDLCCPVCFKVFTRPKAVKSHLKCAHPTQVFHCSKCTKTFQTSCRLVTHLQAHATEKESVSSYCGKRLPCPKELKTHIRLRTGKRLYACNFCPKKFNQKPTLAAHIRLHRREQPYLCSYCGKTFSHKGALVIHTRLHTGERPYRCEECGQTYRTLQALKIHQASHSDQRPYSCPQCGKTFRFESGLRRHGIIHSEEKPYHCAMCNERFNQSGNLKMHMKSHITETKATIE